MDGTAKKTILVVDDDPAISAMLAEQLTSAGYDAVCFACYIWNIEKTLHVCENLKKAFPKMVIVLGGPEVSYDAEELLKAKPFVDVVIRGEGEKVLPDFLEALAAKNDKAVKNEATNDNIGCRIIDGGCVAPEDVPKALNKVVTGIFLVLSTLA